MNDQSVAGRDALLTLSLDFFEGSQEVSRMLVKADVTWGLQRPALFGKCWCDVAPFTFDREVDNIVNLYAGPFVFDGNVFIVGLKALYLYPVKAIVIRNDQVGFHAVVNGRY